MITAVLSGLSQSEAARRYGVSQGWVSKLLARYRLEGEAAFEPKSRRPKTSPNAMPPEITDLVVGIRRRLIGAGLDAGAETIGWHLQHTHGVAVSRATINRILTRAGLVTPEPAKRPKSSYVRFEAAQPNECWQSDFTHCRLADGTDTEVIAWLDDHSRCLLHLTAHPRITAGIVAEAFHAAAAEHGYPASTLTDNGMVYTVRLAGGKNAGGRTILEHELRRLGIVQKNGRPNHPTTQGKIERLWQTLKKWLKAQPDQPDTIGQLQALLDEFAIEYNTRRPHRSLPRRATPAAIYATGIKTAPAADRSTDAHDRVREDRVDKSGTVTLRVHGKLRHIGIGRPHTGTHVKLLVHDLDITVVNATTGQILRELTIDTTRDYQPRGQKQ
ncbi:IS481 family transposase [Sinomonas sp. JGH33]|uniref:IS481 family transposase n=1 Tax=Sinomonas terricola TaxID=3110330 RepID=A0ABU5TCW9_9MICC|nr:IS481 family transposase [Sinomonas sp. JGH33]MEA5457392.1 IS481 family transposase [Sinomonas sp. JGH33]